MEKFLVGVLFLITFWWINKLSDEINELKKQIASSPRKAKKAVEPEAIKEIAPETPVIVEQPTVKAEKTVTPKITEPKETSEQFIGARLNVWMAGIAAILGVFFLVKYSIDMGYFGPKTRLALTTVFGLTMIISGMFLHAKKHIANNTRIAEAFMGVGLSALYFVAYALSRIYDYVPLKTSFSLMCAVTIGAIILALRYPGQLVALLGLIGGMLTPALTSSNSSTAISFSLYLMVLSTAFVYVGYKAKSTAVAALSLIFTILWVGFWGINRYSPSDALALILLLVAVSTSLSIFSPKDNADWNALPVMGLVSAGLFSWFFLVSSNFAILEWGVIGLLTSAVIVLTIARPKQYKGLLWIMTLMDIFIFYSWIKTDAMLTKQVLAGMSLVLFLPAYILLFTPRLNVFALFFSIITPIVYSLWFLTDVEYLSYYGLALAVVTFVPVCKFIFHEENKDDFAGYLFLSGMATTTIALAKLVQIDTLPILYASEFLLITAVMSFGKIKHAKYAQYAFAILFFMEQYLDIFKGMLLLIGAERNELRFYANILTFRFFFGNILLPVFCFIPAAVIGREKFIKYFSLFISSTLSVLGLMSVYMLYYLQKESGGHPPLMAHAVLTAIIFATSMVCLYLKRTNTAIVFYGFGMWRVMLVSFASILQDGIHYANIAEPIVNYALPLGFAIVWMLKDQRRFLSGFAFALSIMTVHVLIKQSFIGHSFSAEMYSYSAVMLALAVAWFFVSLKRDYMMKPTFALFYIVAFKVFFYDTKELEGLWKPLSFFGLAICLFGISYLYVKYAKKPLKN